MSPATPIAAPATSGSSAASSPAAAAGSSPTSTGSDAGTSSEAPPETPAAESAPAEATDAESSGTYGSDKERIDAAVLALEKDDLDGAVKALGRDVKLKGVTTKAFKALSVRERKHAERVRRDQDMIAKAKTELQADSARASNLLRHTEQKFGWVAKAEQAWEDGRYVDFAKAVERMAKGSSLATITQRIASAGMGKTEPATPEERALAESRATLKAERDAFEKQKADEKAAAEKAKGQQSISEKRATALGKFAATHKAHPFLKNPDDPEGPDPDALAEAFQAYEQSWKNGRFEKTPKQVLDELHAREVRKLKRLGITPAAAAQAAPVAKAGTSTGKPPPKPRLAEPPKTAGGKRPSLDDTRESRIALARRMTEQQTRGMRP